MAGCYSDAMRSRHPSRLPKLWLISDARNDAELERALKQLPRGSGLVFRHYHLDESARRKRHAGLARLARQRGQAVVLSGPAAQARRWGADGAYGDAGTLARGPAALRLITVHSLSELGRTRRADAVLLSPVFATRSHPKAKTLGPLRFRLIAQHARVPVIALGGINLATGRRLKWPFLAAIDGPLR